jgi:predicted PurR-regulated permease PerM
VRRETDAELSPEEIRASSWWWIRFAAIFGALFLGYQLFLIVQSLVGAVFSVFSYFILGLVVTFLLGPFVNRLQRGSRFPRWLAVLTVFAGFLLVVGGFVFLAVSPAIDEADQLRNQLPSLVNQASTFLAGVHDNVYRTWHIDITPTGLPSQGQVAQNLANVLVGTLTGTLRLVLDIVVTFVVAFWLLNDGHKLRAGFLALLPSKVRAESDFFFEAVALVVGGYLRAQVVIAGALAVLTGIMAAVVGIPYPLVIAVIVGVFELIPLVGPFIGGVVAMMLALTKGPVLFAITLVLFLLIHVFDGYVLAPRVQARFVRIHPLVAILALVAGAQLGGFFGAFLAIPMTSLIAVLIRAGLGDWRARRPDDFVVGEGDADAAKRRRRLLGEFKLLRRT